MTSTRVALARGFAVAVVVVLLLSLLVLLLGGVSQQWLLAYFLALVFAVTGAAGIWYEQFRVAAVGTLGFGVGALLLISRTAFLFVLAVLLAVSLVVAWNGRAREQLKSQS
ncbi:hypothetical protein [Halorussus halophilus]|uniref:hypothetical protein n=1 Tax=Halorussus halophilus TaxID=2650975 RepID=UPI0013010BA0|nr:hypothetical protein [Halorussus halophilus]